MSKEIIEPTAITVDIDWHIPDTIITRFASNMVVQSLENEFRISFFETMPKIQLDPKVKPPNTVKADCVASVIVNANKLPEFIKVLEQQLERYNSLQNKK